MNYLKFHQKYRDRPLLLSREVLRGVRNPQVLRNQLNRWQDKKLLLKLRRGAYVFMTEARPDRSWIANKLYEPSYLSLEYALDFYDLIPDRVADVTSLTTLKTMRFENKLGHFIYRHVNPRVFRGFRQMGDAKLLFFMAEPEKAVVDFLYFKLPVFKKGTAQILKESFRFQNYENLDPGKLKRWADLFENAKLTRVIDELCRMIRRESS